MKNVIKYSRTIFFLWVALFLLLATNSFAEDVPNKYKQPIAFSHKTHALKNEVPCEYCHIYARRSLVSGIPPVRTCYGCHATIEGTTEKQQEEIKKVVAYWESQTPIPWKKIYDVPDFVHFSHKRHIQVGFDCVNCHGDVSKLDEINMGNMQQELGMGWCLDCHAALHPTVDGKVTGPKRITRGSPRLIENVTAKQPNGTLRGSKDCFICHK